MTLPKRLTALLIALILVLAPACAYAAGSIAVQQETSLTLTCKSGETTLSGVSFALYRVASVAESGELTPTEAFSQFDVMIRGENDDAWRELATTLEGYVQRDALVPAATQVSDADGIARFTGLETGLYLVLGKRLTLNGYYYDPMPFLILLPALDAENNVWIYDVEADVKFSVAPVPVYPSWDELRVIKAWDDEGHEDQRPQSITIQLLRDGEVYDTVVLSAENGWRYSWSKLDAGHRWSVTEDIPDGYTVTVRREGDAFVVTNTYSGKMPGKPTDSGGKLPQTGQLWWPVPLLLASGLLLVVLGLIRRRGADHAKQ